MMRGVPASVLFIPFEHREISHPEELPVSAFKSLVPRGVLLRQRETEKSRALINLCLHATQPSRKYALGGLVSGNDDREVVFGWFYEFVNLGDEFGPGLFETLEVVEELYVLCLARLQQSLMLVALFARKLADVGYANGDDREIRFNAERLLDLRGECFSNVGNRRKTQVGLIDAVIADGIVITHAREGRGEFEARG